MPDGAPQALGARLWVLYQRPGLRCLVLGDLGIVAGVPLGNTLGETLGGALGDVLSDVVVPGKQLAGG